MVRSIALTIAAACAVAALSAQTSPQGQGTFRTTTDVVTVDVSVEQNDKPVVGLTSKDFIVTDNTVRQEVEAATSESLPANVTLLVDTGGGPTSLEGMRRDIAEAAALMRTDDQLRVLSLGADVTLVSPMQPASVPVPIDKLLRGGRPPLLDHLALSLFRKRPPDRGELVLAFTPGIDRGSIMPKDRLERVARQTEAVLHVVLVVSPGRDRLCYMDPYACKERELNKLAQLTGGRMVRQDRGASLPAALREALSDFHTSYTLRYTARGVERAGWHEIGVKIAKPGKYTVRARRGYVGGGA